MPFDAKRLQDPFEKVIKATRATGKLKDPERVHKLRTNTRRVEAILQSLELPGCKPKRLLKDLKNIRKSAGKVRDMDVLTAKAADVSVSEERSCQVQLLLHLGAERKRKAAHLKEELEQTGKRIRTALQGCAKQIDLMMHAAPEEQRAPESHAASHALQLSGELKRFAPLGRRNLHEFRIEGKQLRYVLQMSKPPDEPLLEALRQTQDAIGEWHDWEELLTIAKDVLDHGRTCGLLRELQVQAETAYDEALRVGNSLRKRFLGRQQRGLRVVEASARLAA